MPPITVRQLNIDLSQGFPSDWLAGDAYRTQFFNATSMSIPIGEQNVIATIRTALPLLKDPVTISRAKGLIGQEAAHRHLHDQFNAQLVKQGLNNMVERFLGWRIKVALSWNVKSRLAIAIAIEHFTVIFAEYVLRHPEQLDGAPESVKALWFWHCVEEAEHKSVAFEVYQAVGGNYWRRLFFYLYISFVLAVDMTVQVPSNLHRCGALLKPSTWGNALRFYWGKKGIGWHTLPMWLSYFRPGFDPRQHASAPYAQEWLEREGAQYREVGSY